MFFEGKVKWFLTGSGGLMPQTLSRQGKLEAMSRLAGGVPLPQNNTGFRS
jgi:hypothetical protein